MALVMDRIQEHYNYATKKYDMNNIVGIFLTGSQNYGTNIESSDVDTQLIITPSLNEIYLGHRPESATLRPSGTEPLVRVMIEGKDQKLIEDEAKKLAELIQNTVLLIQLIKKLGSLYAPEEKK